MSELKTISIDGTEYDYTALSEQQKIFVAHIQDTDARLAQLQFQADQLLVTKNAFLGMLKASLTAPEEQK